MANDFQKLFHPKSIAIIGASDEQESVGKALCTNLKEYSGTIYFVNPKHKKLFDKTCFASVSHIGNQIDLAIIATPAQTVPALVEKIGTVGIKCLIIISAGFKETSEEGAVLEEAIHASCVTYGITLIGPNCLGILNPENHLNASFAATIPPAGSIAFISQSGAICSSVIDYAQELSLGFSKFVSIGNKTCVDERSLLTYLADDEKTKAIFLYVEDIKDAAGFIQTCSGIDKPIVLLKGGTTDIGAKATMSHTGALGGNDLYYDALSRQAGIMRVRSLAEMFNLALVISHNPPPAGGHVAIITNAGGPGILMTDEAIKSGLTMRNTPVDLLGDAKAQQYKNAIEKLEQDSTVDSELVLLTPQSGTEIKKTAHAIIDTHHTKPLVVSFMGKTIVSPGITLLRESGIAVTEYPEEAARALGQYTNFALNHRIKKEAFIPVAPQQFSSNATELLSSYGFSTMQTLIACSPEETQGAVEKIGKPCAIKINSMDIPHKTDVGGVLLNISADTAQAAFTQIINSAKEKAPNIMVTGVTVEEMAPVGGTEFILGFTRKEHFGTVIMAGLGGIFVEIMKDVVFGIAPLSKSDAKQMIASLICLPILNGFRGKPPLDSETLVDYLGRISQLALDCPQIAELDINPLLLYPKGQGAKVVDIRLRLYPHA